MLFRYREKYAKMSFFFQNRLIVFGFVIMIGLLGIYVYCEYLIYYIIQVQCFWPNVKSSTDGFKPLFVMLIADLHLLGSRNGHWFDKWRREWQMHRAFQTAMTLHKPDVVFVLGDLFDEGKWCSENEFDDYVARFNKFFRVPEGTEIYSIVGNHDIGFHYRTTPRLFKRFEKKLHSPPVQVLSLKGNNFVLINSMALEGDGCNFCKRAEKEIDRISDMFKCTQGSSLCKGTEKLPHPSRPIVLQHFPLYRASDAVCGDEDAAPLPERDKPFAERWDCLSKESTERVVEALQPRAVLGGHTHHGCTRRHELPHHRQHFLEYSVPSFSHRNRPHPKYILMTVTPEEYRVAKCGVPSEMALCVSAAILLLLLVTCGRRAACLLRQRYKKLAYS